VPGINPLAGIISFFFILGLSLIDRPPKIYKNPTDSSMTLVRGKQYPFTYTCPINSSKSQIRLAGTNEVSVTPESVSGKELQAFITAHKRGDYNLPPVHVRQYGYLRLGRLDQKLVDTFNLTVIPDIPGAKSYISSRRRGTTSAEEGRLRTKFGLGTEFESLRDYTTNDDIRLVNWLCSSRVNRYVVNQYRIEQNQDVYCLLDAGRLMTSPIANQTRLDIAMDAMTFLMIAAEDAEDKVGLTAFSNRLITNISPRRKNAEYCIKTVYDLEPEQVDSDYESVLSLFNNKKRGLLAIFTDIPDEESMNKEFFELLSIIRKKHAIMVISAIDDQIYDIITKGNFSKLDPYKKAAALETKKSIDSAISKLRSLKIEVIYEHADQIPKKCVDAYFRLKARIAI
jgi:uncharacterized protein (DUF58 family)